MRKSKPKAELDLGGSKRGWIGIVWHHSATGEGAMDWDDIVRLHTSHRVNGKPVDPLEFRKAFIQRQGSEFGDPLKAVGFHAGVEYAELDGVIAPVIRMGRPMDTAAEACSHPKIPGFDSSHLSLLAIGDFNSKAPRPEMWDTCLRLTRTLMDAFSITADRVLSHREASEMAKATTGWDCPGRLWSFDKFRGDL